MPKLILKNTHPSQRSQSATSSPRSTLSKAAESFASKWLFRFSELNLELESAKHEREPDEDNFDAGDDGEMRHLAVVGHTQELLISFDEEATTGSFTSKTFTNKPDVSNPFLVAEDMREFVYTFLTHWDRVRNEGWHGLPRGTTWIRPFIKKLNELFRENKKLKPMPGMKKPVYHGGMTSNRGRPKGSGKKKKKADSDDDDYE
ncbi:hypothetical protein M409DRAFT_19151 [Zasmidium cellare ATCC 36951]|uniref:Uncharacterized protein n=1 Tax=Zasmidium cellare ATCC 36951 TaxID=1080233 RepID=A0A6A6CVV3_ZASCE|nr:uncharacterized protein M409DRAFT_19151 [Zasmidium cellare ATCC 36951]KAF2170330.1 hypothetical protein M409DRAFT_19151 [Zasmidium cellare ATCC 36951]